MYFGVRPLFIKWCGPSKTVGVTGCFQQNDLIQKAYADGETQFNNRLAIAD